jgi:Pyruvate/2-oxoacid:ferredoxin oxidoreductase gamma subunit
MTANIETILKENGIFFLSYGGEFTQTLISGMTKVLEKKVESSELNKKISNNIFVVFIEMGQNILNYSKQHAEEMFDSRGLICVGKENGHYFITSQNLITAEDKAYIETKLAQISTLSKEEIKRLYKETRRAKRDTYMDGAGLGLLEIARKSSQIEHSFKLLGDDKFLFELTARF